MSQNNKKTSKSNKFLFLTIAIAIALCTLPILAYLLSTSHTAPKTINLDKLTPETLQYIAEICEKKDLQAIQKQRENLNKQQSAQLDRILLKYNCLHVLTNDEQKQFYIDNVDLLANFELDNPSPLLLHAIIQKLSSNNPRPYIDFLEKHANILSNTQIAQILHAIKLNNAHEYYLLASKTPRLLPWLMQQPPSEHRNKLLRPFWPYCPPKIQKELLEPYLSVNFYLQNSGSSQLPQLLGIQLTKKELPPELPEFSVELNVDYIKSNNKDLQRSKKRLASSIQWPQLHEPNTILQYYDLQPWLTVAAHYKIEAQASLYLHPKPYTLNPAYENIINDKIFQLLSKNNFLKLNLLPNPNTLTLTRNFSKNYRTFQGVVTGSPYRIKDEKINATIANHIKLEICNEHKCTPLLDPQSQQKPETLDVEYGKTLYLKMTPANQISDPIAIRLMAKSQNTDWIEVSSLHSFQPTQLLQPTRAELDLRPVCTQRGLCILQFELRPSLRMGRRDPRIQNYWGSTLQLPQWTANILTAPPSHQWSNFTKNL